MTKPNAFDARLESLQRTGEAGLLREALIQVGDTAEACLLWFQSFGVQATAADIVAMTRLVMEREEALNAAELAVRDADA